MASVPTEDIAEIAEAKEAMLERAYHAAAPVLEPWFGEEVLRNSLAKELDHDLNLALEHCSINAASSASHRRVDAVRIIRISDDRPHWIVIQLQRQDETSNNACVIVKHRSCGLANDADVALVAQAAGSAFPDEQIERVAVICFNSKTDPCPAGAIIQTSYVAAPVRELHLPTGSHMPAALTLERPDSMSFYGEYEMWYHEFWRKRPELTKQVPIETHDDLERCLNDGSLRLICLGGEPCGLLATMRHVELGMKGWRICEKVIAPAFWERGLSAPATIVFARSLPSEPDDALWGTIVPDNRSSLRSAKLIGRRVIGSVHWLSLK